MTEKLYTDFTNNILPAIQEGLVITQEYFTELFSRYIKYLIVTDADAILSEFARRRKNSNFISSLQEKQ